MRRPRQPVERLGVWQQAKGGVDQFCAGPNPSIYVGLLVSEPHSLLPDTAEALSSFG